MTRGKQTCGILKEIRRRIAEVNDIEYVTTECPYKGDCSGTCPKCESEVRYLEEQLRVRSVAGKSIILAGISAGMIFMAGCTGKSSGKTSEEIENERMQTILDSALDTTWREHIEEIYYVGGIGEEDSVEIIPDDKADS